MAGKIDDGPIGIGGKAFELPQLSDKIVELGVVLFDDLSKADPPKSGSDIQRILYWLGKFWRVQVAGIADDQRHSTTLVVDGRGRSCCRSCGCHRRKPPAIEVTALF